ncbi:MAG TPA: hypothetical protein VHV79_10755 [Mycobacteriales bacterium]|nr:hypothetical protein [Mycobacteriales bacterium]
MPTLTHHVRTERAVSVAGNPAGRAAVPRAGRAVNTSHPTSVIGSGRKAGCTSAQVVKAVAKGGIINFDCGPNPITITMTATAKVRNTSHRVVLDGGGLVTLSGAGKRRILYQNTCDKRQTWTTDHCNDQKWPELIVENLTLAHGDSEVRQTSTSSYGGGAIFDTGGRLRVVNTSFLDNRCYRVGPDLGGAAIRALEQWHNQPIYITRDTFRGGRCSNGSALSSIGVSWIVLNSLLVNNNAIGHGANPASSGSPGGGSGGAIYLDGDRMSLTVKGSVMRDNHAREGGGAIFFVSDNNTGTLTISHSTLHNNPSAGFWTRPYPGIFFQSAGHHPKVIHSTIS